MVLWCKAAAEGRRFDDFNNNTTMDYHLPIGALDETSSDEELCDNEMNNNLKHDTTVQNGRMSPTTLVASVHIWLALCFHFLSVCFKRLSDMVLLHAFLHDDQGIDEEVVTELRTNDLHDYKLQNSLVRDERLDFASKLAIARTPVQYKAAAAARQLQSQQLNYPSRIEDAAGIVGGDQLSVVDATTAAQQLLRSACGRVVQTQYISTVFETDTGGIAQLLPDVDTEMQHWFGGSGYLAIACEATWSVPTARRERQAEVQLKTKLGRALRINNRRIMDLKRSQTLMNGGTAAPLMINEATTKETCGRNRQRQTFQGVFKRFYSDLLPYQHQQTSSVHEPYWRLDATEQSLKPQPEKYLLGRNRSEAELKTRCLVALHMIVLKIIIAAESERKPENRARRLLRIELIDENDNRPEFPKESDSMPLVLVVPENGVSLTIGRVTAQDNDSPPLNQFRYYFLATCGDSWEKFNLNDTTGDIALKGGVKLGDDDMMQRLCVLASPELDLQNPVTIDYAPANRSMIEVLVQAKRKMRSGQRPEPPVVIRASNNTIVAVGADLVGSALPLADVNPMGPKVRYSKQTLEFKSKGETVFESVADTDLIVVDANSGQIRASPELMKLPGQGIGIYRVHIAARTQTELVAELVGFVHVIEKSRKLMYVFGRSRESLEGRMDQFSRALHDLLAVDTNLKLIFDNIKTYGDKKKADSSKVCFHVLNGETLMDRDEALQMLGKTARDDAKLRQFYTQFGAVDLVSCEELVLTAGVSRFAKYIWVLFAALLALLILLTLACYVFYLKRYKPYMIKKEQYKRVMGRPVGPKPTSPPPQAAITASGDPSEIDNTSANPEVTPVPKFLELQLKEYSWKESTLAFG